MKLHLGCGNDYKEGYLNCDWTNNVRVDRIVDLEKPLKMFKTNSVDEIVCNHVLEHIVNFVPLMHELHRISKKGAIIKIIGHLNGRSASGRVNLNRETIKITTI